MDLSSVRLICQAMGITFVSASRPALGFAAIQVTVAIGVALGMTSLPPNLAWLVQAPVVAAGVTLAVVEWISHNQDGAANFLRESRLERVLGAFSACGGTLLFAAMGAPVEALELPADPAQVDLLLAAQAASETTLSGGGQTALLAAAFSANLALTWLRAQLHEALDDLHLVEVWRRIESGGAVALLLLLLVAPVLLAAMVVALVIGLIVLELAVQAVQRRLDAQRREPCGDCDHGVRKEALVCPACGASRQPSRVLAQPGPLLSRVRELQETVTAARRPEQPTLR